MGVLTLSLTSNLHECSDFTINLERYYHFTEIHDRMKFSKKIGIYCLKTITLNPKELKEYIWLALELAI